MYRFLLIFFLVLAVLKACPAGKTNEYRSSKGVTYLSSIVWKHEWVRWVNFDEPVTPSDVRKRMLHRFLRHGYKVYFICFIPINNR
jgi:hypothetical protein